MKLPRRPLGPCLNNPTSMDMVQQTLTTQKETIVKRIVVGCVAAAVVVPAVAVGVSQAAASAESEVHGQKWSGVHGKKARIANALSAAPKAISSGARVLDYGAKATDPFVLLRKGNAEWTCFPDWPDSPGNDPACYDRNGMRWLEAYYAGTKPHLTGPGISYGLQGGGNPSLTDPAATAPAKGDHWFEYGPTIVVFPDGKVDPKAYGNDYGGSFVMWPRSPYAHLHLPVSDSGGMAHHH